MQLAQHEELMPVAKVLCVDDALFMRTKAIRLLASHGYEVLEAVDGADAVDKYFQEKPDVVLMDITMPVLGGIDAVKAIRERDPEAKIVMVTALSQRSMVLEAIRAGARDFVMKPYDPIKLLDAVRKQCQP